VDQPPGPHFALLAELARRNGLAKLSMGMSADFETAVRFGDIIITATNSSQPVVQGEWLRSGTHVNAIGANASKRREMDDRTLARAGTIAVDSIDQAKEEAGDLIQGLVALERDWSGIVELCDIVAGAEPGRISMDEITIFKSCGLALWDVASAGYVYRQAREKRKGKALAIWGK